MFRAYLILNAFLFVLAVAATIWLVPQRYSARLTVTQPGAGSNAGRASAASPGTTIAGRSSLPPPSPPSQPDIEQLWERVVFNPSRREGIQTSETGETQSPLGAVELELIAIGKVGPQAAAVILQRTPARPGMRASAQGKRHVYQLGDQIEGTGYTVEEITLTEVVLAKDDEQRVLRLSTDEEARRARIDAAGSGAGQPVPGPGASLESLPPPPPPALPGSELPALPGLGEEGLSREERIQRALERRREYIEQLRQRRLERSEQ